MKKIISLCVLAACAGNAFAVNPTTTTKPTAPQACIDILLDLTNGVDSPEVLKLHSFLSQHGYLKGKVNNRFDAATINAVKKFQNDYGVVSNGKAGPLTRGKIKAITCLPASKVPKKVVSKPVVVPPVHVPGSYKDYIDPAATSTPVSMDVIRQIMANIIRNNVAYEKAKKKQDPQAFMQFMNQFLEKPEQDLLANYVTTNGWFTSKDADFLTACCKAATSSSERKLYDAIVNATFNAEVAKYDIGRLLGQGHKKHQHVYFTRIDDTHIQARIVAGTTYIFTKFKDRWY